MTEQPHHDPIAASFPEDGYLRKMSFDARQRLIGEILSLFMMSDFHMLTPLGEICVNILGAVDANQFKLYRRGNRVVGYVSWAYLSDEINEAYKTGGCRLRPIDWKSGAHGWIIDFVAPMGDAIRITRDLRHNVFPNDTGHSFRGHSSRRGDGVRVMRGAKAGRNTI